MTLNCFGHPLHRLIHHDYGEFPMQQTDDLEYIVQHQLAEEIQFVLKKLVEKKPEQPMDYLIQHFEKRAELGRSRSGK